VVLILVAIFNRMLDPIALALPVFCWIHLIIRSIKPNKQQQINLIKTLKSYFVLSFPNLLLLITLMIALIQLNIIGKSTLTKDALSIALRFSLYSLVFGMVFFGNILYIEVNLLNTIEQALKNSKAKERDYDVLSFFFVYFFSLHVIFLGLALFELVSILSFYLKYLQ